MCLHIFLCVMSYNLMLFYISNKLLKMLQVLMGIFIK